MKRNRKAKRRAKKSEQKQTEEKKHFLYDFEGPSFMQKLRMEAKSLEDVAEAYKKEEVKQLQYFAILDHRLHMAPLPEGLDDKIIELFNQTTRKYIRYISDRDGKTTVEVLKDLIHSRMLPYYGYKLHDRIQNKIVSLLTGPEFNPSFGGHKVSISNDPYAAYDIKLGKSKVSDALEIEIKTSVQTLECKPTFSRNIRKAISKYNELRTYGPTLLIQYTHVIESDQKHNKTEIFYDLSLLNNEDFTDKILKARDRGFWSALYINPVHDGGPITFFQTIGICEVTMEKEGEAKLSSLYDIINPLIKRGHEGLRSDIQGNADWSLGGHGTETDQHTALNIFLENINVHHEILKRLILKEPVPPVYRQRADCT